MLLAWMAGRNAHWVLVVRGVTCRTATAHEDGLWSGPLRASDIGPTSRVPNWQSPVSLLSRVLAACLLVIVPAGCAGIKAHDARLRNAVEDGWERVQASRGLNVSVRDGCRPRPPAVAGRGPGRPGRRGAAAGGSSSDPIRARRGPRPGGVVLSRRPGLANRIAGRGAGLVSRCGDSRRAGPRRPGRLAARPGRRDPQSRSRTADPARPGQRQPARVATRTGARSWRRRDSRFAARPRICSPSGSATCAWRTTIGSREWITFIARTAWECR